MLHRSIVARRPRAKEFILHSPILIPSLYHACFKVCGGAGDRERDLDLRPGLADTSSCPMPEYVKIVRVLGMRECQCGQFVCVNHSDSAFPCIDQPRERQGGWME